MARKRDELQREFSEFVSTKQELLKLRVQELTEPRATEAIRAMRVKIGQKREETQRQFESFIADYRDIAEMKKNSIAQTFNFEKDALFIALQKSPLLSEPQKYAFRNALTEFRQDMVDKYLTFY